MIILEASEARTNTRLPQSVIDASQIIDGLEMLTGADVLVSPLSKPILPDKLADCKPHRTLLKMHTECGMLAQRKDGRDLLNSIGDLCRIENRMLEWTGVIGPWLLVVGEFTATRSGQTLVNGDAPDPPTLWASFTGALDWWQLRGGSVTILPRPGLIAGWLKKWHGDRLHQLGSTPDKIVLNIEPAQGLKNAGWWEKLAFIPDIGPVKAQIISDWLPPEWQNLSSALVALLRSDGDLPKGVGPGTVRAIREFLDLADNDEIVIKGKSEAL